MNDNLPKVVVGVARSESACNLAVELLDESGIESYEEGDFNRGFYIFVRELDHKHAVKILSKIIMQDIKVRDL